MRDDLPEVAKTPCNECPWRRDATPGHLGPHDAETWALAAHGENAIACHVTLRGDGWDQPGVRQCAGAATFRGNIFKLPRDPNIATNPADHEHVFSNNAEFIQHHKEQA